MRVLMIEDEPDFVASVKEAFQVADDTTLLMAKDVGVISHFDREGTESIEEQLVKLLSDVTQEEKVDLVLLDTDLSREPEFETQTVYRQSFRQIGIPVCRYRKKARQTLAHNLELIYRLATDGATAVSVPHEAVVNDGPENCLVDWLKGIDTGFRSLREELEKSPKLLTTPLGPAGILARLLKRPGLHPDLLGYTAPSVFFFGIAGGQPNQNIRSYATGLGYWLVNYVLAFPGPILHRAATAAYLNITLAAMDREDIQRLILPASYDGPFATLDGGHYWSDDLAKLVEEWGGDIAEAPDLDDAELERINTNAGGQAFYCMLTQKPISEDEAAPTPDWIPPGAAFARISRDHLDQLGPMLSI